MKGNSSSSGKLLPPITVEAPASSANLGPGYDVFALALAKPCDRLVLHAKPSSFHRDAVVEIRVTGSSGGRRLSISPEANAASAVALKIAREFGIRHEISIVLRKEVPIGVGLGSSAASSAAAASAMNEYFGLKLRPSELVRFAAHGEFVSSGVEHYDNVSASLMGGFVMVEDGQKGLIHRFDPPRSLRLCLATPKVKLPGRKTEYARSILPRSVELGKLALNIAAASSVIAGFATGNVEAIGYGVARDWIVEPARSVMVPGYADLKKGALDSGASGVCMSGAGPTMLAIVDNRKARAALVLKSMLNSFKMSGTLAEGFITTAGPGARVVTNGH